MKALLVSLISLLSFSLFAEQDFKVVCEGSGLSYQGQFSLEATFAEGETETQEVSLDVIYPGFEDRNGQLNESFEVVAQRKFMFTVGKEITWIRLFQEVNGFKVLVGNLLVDFVKQPLSTITANNQVFFASCSAK